MARACASSAICLALWLVPVAALLVTLGPGNVFSQIAMFFSTMAVVTFGGAYAVLAYVAQQAVENYRLAAARRDAGRPRHGGDDARPAHHGAPVRRLHGRIPRSRRAVAADGGRAGGLLATWVTFVPCFLFIFLGAPFIEVLRGNRALQGRLSAITAAVVGVVLNLAIWFAIHTVFPETRPVQSVRPRPSTRRCSRASTRGRCCSRRQP